MGRGSAGKERGMSSPRNEPTPGRAGEWVKVGAEALLWLWVLGILAYFLHTRKYLSLLSFVWEKIVG